MKTRIVSSLIMLPFIALVFIGGTPLFVSMAIVSFVALHEFYNGFENMGVKPFKFVGYACTLILFGIVAMHLFGGLEEYKFAEGMLFWVAITTFSGLCLSLFTKDTNNIQDSLATIIGVMYIPFFYVHISLIDQLPENSIMVWMVFLTAFMTDIFAYFSGVFLGKTKLIPHISPKKTVEGSIGGIIGSTCICAVVASFVAPQHLLNCLAMGFFGSFVAQCGDLVASAFKRKMGIKDYGNLIPGHGGILDRFDSVLMTAPFVYYFVVLFINR
ncbi:MAG: phosphatidate cytidylyltransferase [Clostridia bacterium]|nr:phosphatidate cytidylyltransferase [Clostridia bacterium]